MTATTTALPGRLRARLTSFTAGLTALTTTAPQALATRYLYRHLAVTEDGTWAWFLVSDEHWYGKTGHGIDGFVTDQAERFAELEGLRFVVRGTHVPPPTLAWVEAMTDDNPAHLPGYREHLERTADWVRGSFRAADSTVALGVRITTDRVPREHLPKLIGEGEVTPRLSVVGQHAATYRRVAQAVARPGLSAAPMSPAGLDWLYARSRALGHDLPEPGDLDRADGWTAPEVDVRATHGEDDLAVRVRCQIDAAVTDRWVRVLRLEAAKTRDTTAAPPWLAWVLSREERAEFVACYDAIPGSLVAKNADDRAFHNGNIATDLRRHGFPVDEWTQQGIDQSEKVAGDTAHGDPTVAVQLWGHVLVAVTGATEQDALDKAAALSGAAAAPPASTIPGPGLRFTAAPAQWQDYRRFIPGEPFGRMRGHLCRHTPLFLAAGAANASNRCGDPLGDPLGNIAGSNSIYQFDPFGGVRLNRPGVFAAIGEGGSGKTTLLNRVAYTTALAGVQTGVYDPSGLMARLAGLPEFQGRSRVIRLSEGVPGMLAPHFLVPEPTRSVYADQGEFERAVRSATAERMSVATDAIMLTIPHGMAEQTEVQQAVNEAVAAVGGDYGTHPQELLDALDRCGDVGKLIARQIRAKAVSPVVQTIWPDRDVTGEAFAVLRNPALLTVVTSQGLAAPPRRATDLTRWTNKQLESRPVLHLGNHFAAHMIWTDRARKLYVADEVSLSAGGASAYTEFLMRLAMDSRKFGASAGLAMQTATPFTVIDEHASSLVGAAFIGRTSAEHAAAALEVLRLRAGAGWEDLIERFRHNGQFLVSGWDNLPAQIRVDQFSWTEGLTMVSDTSPVQAAPRLLTAVGGLR